MLIKPLWELSQSENHLVNLDEAFLIAPRRIYYCTIKKLNQAIKAEKVDTAEVTNSEINVNNS